MMFVYYSAIYNEEKSDFNLSDEEKNDKLSELKDYFQNKNEDEVFILISAITDEPFIFCTKLKNHFPDYIHFHICSYLHHLDAIPQERSYDDIFLEFTEYLMTRCFSFQININYFSVFTSDPRTVNLILDFFSHKAIIRIFKTAEMTNNSENMVDNINSISNLIVKFKHSKRIELSIYRVFRVFKLVLWNEVL